MMASKAPPSAIVCQPRDVPGLPTRNHRDEDGTLHFARRAIPDGISATLDGPTAARDPRPAMTSPPQRMRIAKLQDAQLDAVVAIDLACKQLMERAGVPASEVPARGQGSIEGQARSVERDRTPTGALVTNFRIARYDSKGNQLRPVAVRLLTTPVNDLDINDGDQVTVRGQWKNGALYADEVRNSTTGASVTPPGRFYRWLIERSSGRK